MKKISNSTRIKHNKILNLKKELTLIFMASSFLIQYEENNKGFKSVKPLIVSLSKISRLYSGYIKDVLDVAEKEMEIVENIQRNAKSSRFRKIAQFDTNNDLVVSAIALSLNLLQIHKESHNTVIVVSSLNDYTSVDYADNENIKNAQIIASRFYERIDNYYQQRKLI